MPEANISPPTDDETTESGAAPATGDEESGQPGHVPAPGEETSEQYVPAARTGLTPRQARRVRIIVSGVVMVAVAVALVVRLGSAPSVLTMGFYGIALILSGTAIVLSRRGRTRVATGVLVLGFAAVALAEWLLASVQ
jgi:hypothetical protein